MTMEIKFIRSDLADAYNGPGYAVWTDQYTGTMKPVGFVSRKNARDMEDYFTSEGYNVKVIEDADEALRMAYQMELTYAD